MTNSTLAGLPIVGEPVFPRSSAGVEQWGEERFSELLRPLVESPRVEAIRWEQYTPYFNDGDVCEFDVHVPEIKVNDRAEAAADEWDDDEYHTIYSVFIEGGYPRRWVRNEGSWGGRWEKYGDEIPRHDDYDAFSELTHAMEKGHFEELLYEKFGDHAQVTVYRDRIAVETYEHE